MQIKEWHIKTVDEQVAAELSSAVGITPIVARLLVGRGIDTPEKARRFIENGIDCLYDPYLLKDMDKAVERIQQARANKERICIYGDYDVDGVTATIVLYKHLREMGIECSYFIPDRMSDGYGLNKEAIDRINGTADLIITVDTGITATEETKYARSLGIDIIITDHHRYKDSLPEAAAVINPHREDCTYPFDRLAGVGVVFKLICALCGKGSEKEVLRKYGDIIAIGTIADVMPIIDENRYISAVGLQVLERTENKGLEALMKKSGIIKEGRPNKRLSSTAIGFTLAPRLNAAGRITSAKRAVALLLSENSEEANAIAEELCDTNRLRQETESLIFEEALKQIETMPRDTRVLVLHSEGWHQGVIGVVASRITERYCLPSILFSFDGDSGKGSGRSVKGFSIMDALKACGDLLEEYGGHELAAGLTISRDKLAEFTERINSYARENMDETSTVPVLDIDLEVKHEELTVETALELQKLEPFGLQNPTPLFALRGAYISDVAPLSDGKHIKMRVQTAPKSMPIHAVYFGKAYDDFAFSAGDVCDIAFSLEMNDYFKVPSIQLYVKQVRPTARDMKAEREAEELIKKVYDSEFSDVLPEGTIPTLNDFRVMFKFLKNNMAVGEEKRYSLRSLVRLVRRSENYEISMCAIRIILDVLAENSLIKCKYVADGAVAALMLYPLGGRKIDLEHSTILSKIREKHSAG